MVHLVHIGFGRKLDSGRLNPSRRIDHQSKVEPAEIVIDSSEEPCLEQVFFATCFEERS